MYRKAYKSIHNKSGVCAAQVSNITPRALGWEWASYALQQAS